MDSPLYLISQKGFLKKPTNWINNPEPDIKKDNFILGIRNGCILNPLNIANKEGLFMPLSPADPIALRRRISFIQPAKKNRYSVPKI